MVLERKIFPFEEPIDPEIKTNLAVVESHFINEALNNLPGVMDTYTEDIEWIGPERAGGVKIVRGKKDAQANYEDIFSGIGDIEFDTLRRSAGKDYVFDVSIIRFTVTGKHFSGLQVGERGEMKLVHLFGMRDGKIRREWVRELPYETRV